MPLIEAVAFGGRRGWVHKGSGGRGAVVCGAWGFEELCSRRSLAYFADRLAEEGAVVLRFDPRGVGDSIETADPEGLLASWDADICAAAQCLREEFGSTEIALAGLRLGAVAATLAASRVGAERLLLLAPPVSGRAMIREAAAFAIMAKGATQGQISASPWDGTDAAGFHLPPQEVARLNGLDLRRIKAPPASKTLIYAPAKTPAYDEFRLHIQELGGEAEVREFGSYAGMMCDPTASLTPVETLREAAFWLMEGQERAERRPVRPRPSGALSEADWIEEPARLDHGLSGVLTRPKDFLHHSGKLPKRAVVFLNAGGIRQAGWGGMHISMARRLASVKVASLRFDARGVGDSPPFDTPSPLFALERREDVSSAIDWLGKEGVEEVTLVGACSGAHHAFHLACADTRVRAVALVNMVCILWGPSYAIQLSAWRATKNAQMQARGLVASADARSEVAALAAVALPLARKVARKSFGALKTLSLLASGVNGRRIVERKFAELAKRNVQVRLVYSEADAGLEELARYMGPDGRRALIYPNVRQVIIPGADHMLTQAHAREALAQEVVALAQWADIQPARTDSVVAFPPVVNARAIGGVR